MNFKFDVETEIQKLGIDAANPANSANREQKSNRISRISNPNQSKPGSTKSPSFHTISRILRGTDNHTMSMNNQSLFLRQGWVELESSLIGGWFYLVKDAAYVRFLPDKKLPVLLPKDVEALKEMSKEELEQEINFRFNLAPMFGREVPSPDFGRMDKDRIHGLEHAIQCNPKEKEWFEQCKAALLSESHSLNEMDARVKAVQLLREKRQFLSLLKIDNRYARRVIGYERSVHRCEDTRTCPHGLDFKVPRWILEDLRRWDYFGHLVDDEIQELIDGLSDADKGAIAGWIEAALKAALPEDVAQVTGIKLLARTVEQGERKTELNLPKLYVDRVGSGWLREIVPQYETIN